VSGGAPAQLNKYKLFADSNTDGINDFPPSYAYLGAEYMEGNNWTPVVNVSKQSSLYGQNLRWHMTYGTFDIGQGSFTPSVSSALLPLYQGPKVNTSTGTIGLQDGAFKLPASAYAKQATGDQINFGLSFPRQPSMRGPYYGLWQRVEGERTTGVAYSTMLWQGGRGLVHAATALQQQSDDALKEYVRNLVKLQGGDKMLLVQVEHGQNDAAFAIPSVGPLHSASNTSAGFADNMDAVIIRMRDVWSKLGYDQKDLMFQYGPYHSAEGPAGDGTGRTMTQRLADYESAVMNLSTQHPEYNLAIVRGSRMVTPELMNANGWFTSATDHAHLNAAGYIGVSEMGVRQIVGYATADELPNRSAVTSLSFQFNSDVSGELSRDDLLLYDTGSDTLLDPFDLAVGWNASTLTATWTFNGLPLGELPAGEYQAILKTSQLGGVVGGEGTVGASGDYVFSFTASPIGVPEPGTAAGAAAIVGFVVGRRARP
jgi:hypothetical protein